ncbi:MAG TPA: mobile mystery protein B [Gammaproteobacteria bacterium]|jgi:Fic-DOC domain mobile mystery protein B|nr:mobile mystery protein B [Gammaproteobacteria bacterium]
MKFEYVIGATPLDADEAADLIPSHITTQNELNEWEAENILNAERWLYAKKNHGDFLTLEFVKKLHEKMFSNTWKWAGVFRGSEKSIGVAPYYISTELKNLLEDIRVQLLAMDDIDSVVIDEMACRFHHRLVLIHPFPNGNGRHSRLMTDFLLVQAGRPRFTWSNKKLNLSGSVRDQYLRALRKADQHDMSELMVFVRS